VVSLIRSYVGARTCVARASVFFAMRRSLRVLRENATVESARRTQFLTTSAVAPGELARTHSDARARVLHDGSRLRRGERRRGGLLHAGLGFHEHGWWARCVARRASRRSVLHTRMRARTRATGVWESFFENASSAQVSRARARFHTHIEHMEDAHTMHVFMLRGPQTAVISAGQSQHRAHQTPRE